MRTRESTNNVPSRGYGKFPKTSVDGRIYGNRTPANPIVILSALSSLSSFVPKGLRKQLRHEAGALGFGNVTQDEIDNAKKAVRAAKGAKNEWLDSLGQNDQQSLANALIAQNSTKMVLTMAANRAVGLDAVFGLLDVGNDAAIKITTFNTLNRISGGAFKVESIDDRDIRSALEGMSSSTALQLTRYKHWGKLTKNVDELCQAVGTTIERCINSKVTGLPSSAKISSFVGGVQASKAAVAQPVHN